jgi:hypothetical protein
LEQVEQPVHVLQQLKEMIQYFNQLHQQEVDLVVEITLRFTLENLVDLVVEDLVMEDTQVEMEMNHQ